MPARLLLAALVTVTTLHAQTPRDLKRATEELDKGHERLTDGRYRDAFNAYSTAIASGDASTRVAARKGRIRASLRMAQFLLATRDAEILSTEVGTDVDALTLYADALWGRGLFDEAEAEYALAHAQFPSSARARFGVARSLATHGRFDDALREVTIASAAAPSDAEMVGFRGYLLERLCRYDEAARVYEASLPVLPRRSRDDADIAKSKMKLLRGFAGRTPNALVGSDATTLHSVPFELRDRKIVFEALVNGRRAQIVLDTGAERTTFSRELASAANIKVLSETVTSGVGPPGLSKLGLGRVDSLTIGSLKIENIPVSVGDISRLVPRWQAESFSPLSIGLSVVVDYARSQLTFGRQLPDEPADITLPLRMYRLPTIRGRLNARHTASFVVDTGGEMMSISTDVAGQMGPLPARRIALRVFGINGIDRDAFLLPGVDMNFSTLEYPSFSVAVLNLRAPSVLLGFQLGGILGYKFLSPYRVAMDFGRGELRLKKGV